MTNRSRSIKPGFFKNEDLAECNVWARLCFAGLWTLADREGRLEDRSKRIKGELFPFDSIDVEPLLAELSKHGFITRYVSEGHRYIHVSEFKKHQNPHYKEPKSSIPSPESPGLSPQSTPVQPEALPAMIDGEAQGFGGKDPPMIGHEASDKPRALVPTDELDRGSNRVGNGLWVMDKEKEKETPASRPPFFAAAKPQPKTAARGCRLPDGWKPGQDGEVFAGEHGLSNGRSSAELAKFRDYWSAQPGRKGVKSDWPATWRNWVRKAVETPVKGAGLGVDLDDMFRRGSL